MGKLILDLDRPISTMAEGNEDFSPGEGAGSSPIHEDIFSVGQEMGLAESVGGDSSPPGVPSSTSSATISLFSELSSEDLLSPDLVPDPTLDELCLPVLPDGDIFLHDNGGLFGVDVHGRSASSTSSSMTSSSGSHEPAQVCN